MLYVLCGIAGLGKSTWAREHLGYSGVCIVSTDAIREAHFGVDFDAKTNHLVFKMAYSQVEEELQKGNRVCFDATSITPRDRRPVIAIGKRVGVPVIAVSFGNDAEMAVLRNGLRDRHVPEATIRSMAERFKPPTAKEGFIGIWTISST